MFGDEEEIEGTHIEETHGNIDHKDFIFDTTSCPKNCECMANLADCGESSKLHNNVMKQGD